jgi:hypothetical protein
MCTPPMLSMVMSMSISGGVTTVDRGRGAQ